MFQLDALVVLRAKVKIGVKTWAYLQLHTQGYMCMTVTFYQYGQVHKNELYYSAQLHIAK